jgi:hypothetical protein
MNDALMMPVRMFFRAGIMLHLKNYTTNWKYGIPSKHPIFARRWNNGMME